MAVVIEKRPIGVVLGSAVSASINQDYSSAFATVNKTSHGLTDGQYVYIKCNVENYNGFWRVDVTNSNEFLLIDAPYVAWIVDADITYYPQETTHGWSCVHLPIVYELSNTRYPTNSVDTARTISSISDDFGLVNLNLSGSLGTFEELAFVKISNAPNSSLNGVYQITDKIANNDVTINLNFGSVTAAGIIGASVQLYYANYNMIVRVYAGINSSHEWGDQKPYELAATLQLVPDSNNRARFSINEILKSYVELKNNLTLATLPNNIDAWTQFYIEVAEQYDTSSGYTISTTTSGYVSDQATFEGYAVNAKLPFKNVHSGYLSEYIMVNSSSKFLTVFAIPVLFACSDDLPDCYNEVSFIRSDEESIIDLSLKKEFYSGGALSLTEYEDVQDAGPGLYRLPLEANCSYDRVDLTLVEDQSLINPTFNGLSPWYIANTSANFSASYSSNSIVFAFLSAGVSGTNDRLRQAFYPVLDYAYSFQYAITISNYVSGNVRIGMRFLDANDNPITVSATTDYTSDGLKTGSISMTETVQANIDLITQVEFFVAITASSSGSGPIATLAELSVDGPEISFSETKRFDIDCGCANQEIRLMWLNNLGGFDQWNFTGETEHGIEVYESGETSENIFPEFPDSYGEFADTIDKQTFRSTTNRKVIYSQLVTQEQADAIWTIKSSPLVQIVNSRTDRRTVIVDSDSFTKFKDGDKTYTVQFNIRYTDDLPSQRV